MKIPKYTFEVQTKYTHEFQILCKEMEPKYGKKIWAVPSLVYATDDKLRRAYAIAQKRDNYSFAYLLGIIKKL